jgi:hypothetical protein
VEIIRTKDDSFDFGKGQQNIGWRGMELNDHMTGITFSGETKDGGEELSKDFPTTSQPPKAFAKVYNFDRKLQLQCCISYHMMMHVSCTASCRRNFPALRSRLMKSGLSSAHILVRGEWVFAANGSSLYNSYSYSGT